MLKVLWLTNIPSPYRVAFFNELGKLCELTVLFERESSSERDDSWKRFHAEHFTPVFLQGIRCGVAEAVCPGVVKYLKKNTFDKIVVTNYSTLTGILAIASMKLRGIPYCIEGDGAFAGSGKGMKEKLKTWMLSKAELCFSTAAEHDKYYRTYGVPEERIVRYPFTSLYKKDLFAQPACLEEKHELRKKLGMTGKHVALSVGRFSYMGGYGKGYDAVIRAVQQLPNDTDWYIVGGAPTEEFACIIERAGLENVHFVDFMDKEALKEYYRAADVFVLMTVGDVWGLVINEAMACGLPVITTDKCVAGLELVKAGVNGYIVKVGDDKALADCIRKLFERDDCIPAVGAESIKSIQNYTIENMAKRHMEIWKG